MSLDVYLMTKREGARRCAYCSHEHTCTSVGLDLLFGANITHNLNQMAQAAGIYKHIWRPEELGITAACELIEPLTAGLAKLKSDPAYFETFNAPNGWGLYEHFVPWVEKYLEACRRYPGAKVEVSR